MTELSRVTEDQWLQQKKGVSGSGDRIHVDKAVDNTEQKTIIIGAGNYIRIQQHETPALMRKQD